MTLVDRLLEHCRTENRSEGFGALVGASFSLTEILRRCVSQRIKVADGVEISIPEGCGWSATEEHGGTLLTFTERPPVVSLQKGMLRIFPALTAVSLRISGTEFEAVAHLTIGYMPLPPFTLTVPLGGGRAE